jgi:hypothetical protein
MPAAFDALPAWLLGGMITTAIDILPQYGDGLIALSDAVTLLCANARDVQ